MANALCHRDYIVPGGAVAVAMYDDRLEIANPGSLHFGITPERLTRPHESRPWNPIIAGVFYRAGLIERWGTGTLNVLDWCRENGNPMPAWTEDGGSVLVTFVPVPGLAAAGAKSGAKSRAESLSLQLLRLLRDGPLSTSEMSARLGQAKKATGAMSRTIRGLLHEGLIERTIPDQPRSRLQRYRLTEKGSERLTALRPLCQHAGGRFGPLKHA